MRAVSARRGSRETGTTTVGGRYETLPKPIDGRSRRRERPPGLKLAGRSCLRVRAN